MRQLATLVAFGALALAVLGPTMNAAPVKRPLSISGATGTVTRLDLGRITVGKTGCALGKRGALLAGGFAVGEHVTMSCLRGVLQTLKLAPVTSGRAGHGIVTQVGAVTVLPPPVPPTSTGTAPVAGTAAGTTVSHVSGGTVCSCGTSSSFTGTTTITSTGISVTGTQTSNGVTTTWVSTNASGTISSFGPADPGACPSTSPMFKSGCDAITVGDMTCAVDPFFYTALASKFATGDTAGIACQDGVLRAIGKLPA